MGNAQGELDTAVRLMATSTDTLQQRLADALTKISTFDLSTHHGTSESIAKELRALQVKVLDKGSNFHDASRKLSAEESASLINRIIDIYYKALSETD
jgi:hypothetical protein